MTELHSEVVELVSPTVVKIDLSYTRNLGNYESIKVGLGIEDFTRNGESVSAATDRVYAFVEKKLIEKMQEIEDELASKPTKRGKS